RRHRPRGELLRPEHLQDLLELRAVHPHGLLHTPHGPAHHRVGLRLLLSAMTNIRKRTAVLGLVVAAVTSAACTDFLAVDNPGSVPSRDLADSTYANLLVNGAVGEFQSMIANTALYGAVLSDELQALHSNVSYGPIDLRDFNNLN